MWYYYEVSFPTYFFCLIDYWHSILPLIVHCCASLGAINTFPLWAHTHTCPIVGYVRPCLVGWTDISRSVNCTRSPFSWICFNQIYFFFFNFVFQFYFSSVHTEWRWLLKSNLHLLFILKLSSWFSTLNFTPLVPPTCILRFGELMYRFPLLDTWFDCIELFSWSPFGPVYPTTCHVAFLIKPVFYENLLWILSQSTPTMMRGAWLCCLESLCTSSNSFSSTADLITSLCA